MLKRYSLIITLILTLILAACSGIETDNSNSNLTVHNDLITKVNLERPDISNLEKLEKPSYVDGDTIKGILKGKEETIRILLIDTPETKHPSKPVQPFGPEASQFTEDFVKRNKDSLYIEFDVEDRDRYDRVLGYVWGKENMLNALLVENGLARVGYIYESVKHLDILREVEEKAKEDKVGIWSIEGYVTKEGFKDNVKEEISKSENHLSSEVPIDNVEISDANGDGKCNDIKGNEGSNGNIYHIPSGQYYEQTKAEQYFCTEQEAEAAGFRKSGR